jgi:hypothetical protein
MGHREVWSQARSLFTQLGRMDSPTSSAFYNALTDVLWHFGQVGLLLSVYLDSSNVVENNKILEVYKFVMAILSLTDNSY